MRRALEAACAVGILLVGCVIGYRGEAEFAGEHDLAGTDELRVALPDTPLTIQACQADEPDTCPALLRYDGAWVSVAGSRADARRLASRPTLRFTRDEGFASLGAELPLSVDGLVDLQMSTITLPDDRDLDLRTGVGDVTVRGVEATVVIDVEVGAVEVFGADAGLAVRTGQGAITVETAGHAELRTAEGDVRVTQTGAARDLLVDTEGGAIEVTLATDADIDLEINTRGRIVVRTPSITTVTEGHFARQNGNRSMRVRLSTPRGDVSVNSVDPP